MPIISNFPSGSSSGGGGLALAACTDIATLVASGKVYIKWTDPDDLVVAGSTLAAWGGTKLVRKAGSAPVSRRDGVEVCDIKVRDTYKTSYFCDSGLTDGTTYYYKLFPYTTSGTYTDDAADEFNATPVAVAPGNVSSIALTAAGNGKLGITWTDPAATVVSDGVTLATWGATKVVVKAGSYATDPDDAEAAWSYNSTTRNAYASTSLTATGLTNGTTYYVTLFPISTDGGVNTNTANRASGTANRMTIATVPSQSGTLTYNGNSQTPTWSNYDSDKMTKSEVGQVNAGTYNTTSFTPKEDYMWSDTSTTAKTPSWTIGRATPSTPTCSPTSVTLNSSNTSKTFTVTRSGDGNITATSSNTSVATTSVNNTTGVVTVNSVNNTSGSATITVTVAQGTNYTAYTGSGAQVSVTASFLPAKKTLEQQTWAEISQVSEANQGANYWSVGDTKSIALSGTCGTLALNTTLYCYILGFNHNSSKEGNGIHFGTWKTAASGGVDVCLVDDIYGSNAGATGAKKFAMNHWGNASSSPYNTNYGGWKGCDARYDILGSTKTAPSGYGSTPATSRVGYDAPSDTATNPVSNTLMSCLPSALRSVMKPMTKYTDNKGNSSNTDAGISSSVDYLPLLAEWEIFGARTYANEYEKNYQAQYTYYSSGNSKVKYKHNATTTTAYWWERSPNCSNANAFCLVHTGGNASTAYSRNSYGLAPAFKI